MYFTTCLFNSISYASSVTPSSCRNRLSWMSADVPTSVQYLTSRWRSILVTVFPYPRIAEQFHRVGDDSLVGVGVARTSSRGNRLAKVSEAWLRFILYNLVHVIHNKSMREVPLQQGCGKQYLVATVTTHEHATRR